MRRWWNLCLAGILAFVLGSVGVAETQFVDSSAGDGVRNAPLRTIGQALSRGVAGDVIRLRKGMFREALAWRDTIIADNAFPAFEQFVFSEMRATPREMGLAILEVTMVDGATMDDSDLSGEVIFDRYADALGKGRRSRKRF